MEYQNYLNILDAYKHCPRCGQLLAKKGNNHLKCTSCQFNFFVNSAATCNIYLLKDQNKLLFAKRALEPYKGYWDMIGGFVDLNENFEQSAKREAMEELGVEIEVGEIFATYYNEYPYQGINMPMINFDILAKITKGEPKAADDISECRWFTFEEAMELDFSYEFIKKSIQLIKAKVENNR